MNIKTIDKEKKVEAEEDIFTKEVGKNIVRLRTKLGFTQEMLANAAGIDRKHIYLIENGVISTSLKTLYLIAKGLNVPPAMLLDIKE